MSNTIDTCAASFLVMSHIRDLENQIKELQAAIAKRDSMVEEMNTATVEFIDAYCGMDDYLQYNDEVEA